MKQNTRLEVVAVKAETANQLGMLVEINAPTLKTSQIQRRPHGVVFVVDRSGSMGGGRLDLVKNTIGELIGRLSPDDHVAIVSFDTEIEIHQPMSLVSSINPQSLRRNLATLDPRGGTNIELGLRAGVDETKKLPSGVEATLILLSDGQANEGAYSPEQLGHLAAQATEHLVKTSTLGIGTGYNEQIMSHVASAGQGNHFAAVELADAVAGLQDEIDGLLQRALEHISCEITVDVPGVNITPLGYVRGNQAVDHGIKVQLGELASGESRGYAFMIDLPKSKAGTSIKVNTVVRAFKINDAQALEESQTIEIEVQEANGFVLPQKDEDVVAEVMAYRLAGIKRRAIDAAMGGDFVHAKQIIIQAQGDLVFMLSSFRNLSPRVRNRIESEQEELKELLDHNIDSFGKRATESMFRTNQSKQDPRKRGR
jgi:Ca-activated chloride channel family protein